MRSPSSGALRGLRAALLGAICVTLAVTGHLLGGGRAPSVWTLAGLAVPMGGVSLLLTSRRCHLRTIAATVAISQVLLHEALVWATAAAGCSVSGDPHAHLGHLGHVDQLAAGPVLHCAPMSSVASMAPMGGGSSFAMIAGHLIAAAATTFALAHGEGLAWRAWRWLTRARVAPRGVPAVVTRPGRAPEPARLGPSRQQGPTRRRGPPLAIA